MRVGVDTGGTFTDVVTEDGRVVKVPSTPADPSVAVGAGIEAVGGCDHLVHGTTVATNALLERRGPRVALVTTAGFADVIEIGRQDRPSLYDPWVDRPDPIVARADRFEVALPERRSGLAAGAGVDGANSPAPQEIPAVPEIPAGAGAVAVVLLHADLDPTDEQAVAAELRGRGHDVSASHEVAPEFREFERTVTTVLNAYLRPACRPYLEALAGAATEVEVLTSAGGLVPLAAAADRPAALLLSGPAAGALAGAGAGAAAGYADCVTFDMGGTSTDVCLVLGGRPSPAAQRTVAGYPVRLPSLDVHTIGAGGGSIASVDAGGALTVGPRSAGALPGPACYGRGGVEPTVTDADLVLGRLTSGRAGLPGIGPLDPGRAASAIATLAGPDAAGIVTVIDAAMVEAVRAVTVRRGVDPSELALVAFGGAGPLHACAIADALGMAAVVIPPRAGVLSAVGLLAALRQVDLVSSWPDPRDHRGLPEALAAIAARARELVLGAGAGGVADVRVAVDCRYAGQGHEVTVASVDRFDAEHERINGYRRPGEPVEVVAIRATAAVASPVGVGGLPAPPERRRRAAGPVAIGEPDCAVWLDTGWEAEVHESGSWVARRRS